MAICLGGDTQGDLQRTEASLDPAVNLAFGRLRKALTDAQRVEVVRQRDESPAWVPAVDEPGPGIVEPIHAHLRQLGRL
jgi:hypothetical protein